MSKPNSRTGTLALVTLFFVACQEDSAAEATDQVTEADAAVPEETDDSDDNESSSETPTSAATTETDPATVPREGPEGCYMAETHVCDCSLDEAGCDEIAGIWTDGCNSCAPSGADAGITTEPNDDDAGPSTEPAGPLRCYLPETHACDCEVDEAGCSEIEGVWTEGCDSCANALVDAGSLPGDTSAPESDASAPLSDASAPPSDASAPQIDAGSARSDAGEMLGDASASDETLGCYMPETHVCDCDADEAQCVDLAGIWTAGCDSCAGDTTAP